MGYRVALTRSGDFFLPLARRVFIANKANARLFVSIHFNSCPNTTANGIEIFFSNGQRRQRAFASYNLAKKILDKTTNYTKFKARGVKKANFRVIRETKMPAVLVEGGFLTNPFERKCLCQRVYLDHLAKGISQGIDSYLKSW